MRKDIIAHILSETNTFNANPLAQFQVEEKEGVVQGAFSLDDMFSDEDTMPEERSSSGPDVERLLNDGLDLHEAQVASLRTAVKYNKAKKEIVKCINDLYTRWNVFLKSEQYKSLSSAQKSIAWDKYKSKMAALKERNTKAKPFVAQAWEAYNNASEAFKSHMGTTPGLWSAFYSLLRDESQEASYFARMGESWQEEQEIRTLDSLINASKEREINEREMEEEILARMGETDDEMEEEAEVLSILSDLGI